MGGSAGLLRRELRITGCIGDPSQKHKLSCICVKHQIYEARKQVYLNREIVNSIIRAMYSSLRLKSILEMKQNLDMPSLLNYLQHHYEEKSTPDLCVDLTATTRMPNETPVDFVLKRIKLIENFLYSSKT